MASVGSGELVEFDCLDASNGQLTARSATADLAMLDFERVDQVSGPVEVAGAEPGDTLQVDVIDLEPADWGWTASIPGFGLLADDFPGPFYKVTAVPGRTGRAEFWPGVRVPLAPFCGEMGVAPATGPRSTIPPDVHGGNMDTRHLVVGSTLFLPVFVPGARFSIGRSSSSPSARMSTSPPPSSSPRATRTPSSGRGRATRPMASGPTS